MWTDSVSRTNAAKMRVFGQAVLYTAPPADAVTLQGIPEAPMREDDSLAYKRFWFLVAAGFDPQPGEFLGVAAIGYRIVKVHPDELGGTWISAEKC